MADPDQAQASTPESHCTVHTKIFLPANEQNICCWCSEKLWESTAKCHGIKLLGKEKMEFGLQIEQGWASKLSKEQGAAKTAPAPGPLANSNDQQMLLSEDSRPETLAWSPAVDHSCDRSIRTQGPSESTIIQVKCLRDVRATFSNLKRAEPGNNWLARRGRKIMIPTSRSQAGWDNTERHCERICERSTSKGRCWYVLAGILTYLHIQQRTDQELIAAWWKRDSSHWFKCSGYEKKGNAGITLEKVDGCCKKQCEFNAVLTRSLNEKNAFDKEGNL